MCPTLVCLLPSSSAPSELICWQKHLGSRRVISPEANSSGCPISMSRLSGTSARELHGGHQRISGLCGSSCYTLCLCCMRAPWVVSEAFTTIFIARRSCFFPLSGEEEKMGALKTKLEKNQTGREMPQAADSAFLWLVHASHESKQTIFILFHASSEKHEIKQFYSCLGGTSSPFKSTVTKATVSATSIIRCPHTWSTNRRWESRRYHHDVKRLKLSRLWQEMDSKNLEVSAAAYFVGGGLFYQAKNSPDISWKKRTGPLAVWLMVSYIWWKTCTLRHTHANLSVWLERQNCCR